MHVDWRPTSDMPSPEAMLTSPLQAVHVRSMLNPSSIGHFMRDNLLALVTVPMNFGLDPRKFVWLQVCMDGPACQHRVSRASLAENIHVVAWIVVSG